MVKRHTLAEGLVVALLLMFGCFADAQNKTADKNSLTGHYEGTAKDEQGQDITVALDLTEKDGAITGMINSSHGDFEVSGGSHKGDAVTLEFNANGASGTISLKMIEDKLTGTWSAGDSGGPIDVKKVAGQKETPKGKS